MSVLDRLFAAVYDPLLMAPVEKRGMAARRARLLGDLTGRVVEIGAGTGINLERYGPALTELVLTEPEAPMADRLEAKLRELDPPWPARVVRAPAEALPVADGSADAVVSTLVLCTVPDPAVALAEVRRVLVPGGRLVFAEHVRATDPGVARWQDRLEPVQRFLGRGCHPNRDTLATLRGAGFAVDELEEAELKGAPEFLRPLIAGVARAA